MKVFYNTKMNATVPNAPSPSKPAKAVQAWKDAGLDITVIDQFNPLTRDVLKLAHSARYVDGVLDLTISDGFHRFDKKFVKTLPWTSGSMYAAARSAIMFHHVACSPTSGFHHAGYSRGGGFCTFNGLMVTAMALQAHDLARRVGIIDCDQHYGDGTDDIINRLGLQKTVKHFTTGSGWHSPSQTKRFMTKLKSVVKDMSESCDVILYQAGADCHIDDPLGGWLTTEQMIQRDRIVFEGCKDRVPLAWNLAGGYQDPIEKVLALHTNTMTECLRVYG